MVSITNAAGWNMTWFDNLLNHFALYPTHLFALLFIIALSKSTVLVSSVLPPASVMLLAGITVSQTSLHPGLTWLAVAAGAETGSVLNYHIGQLMGHTRLVTRFTSRHAEKFLRVQHQLQKNGVLVLFTARFLAVLRYIVPLAAGMLRLNAAKVYAVSLISAVVWAALYVGIVTGISAF
jgi:membrane protein DedA with SNARE-associated domain